MKIIITEEQYERLLLESKHDSMNFYNNFDAILSELLEVPEFREDLKEHSYNKNRYTHWWKKSKEDMEELIRDKYCDLFVNLAKKYKFLIPVNDDSKRFRCWRYGRMFGEGYFHKLRGNRYEGDDAPINDSNYWYEGPPWVSEYFMKIFYGKNFNPPSF